MNDRVLAKRTSDWHRLKLRAFCERTGIPGRRKKYWGISTWYTLLQPHVLMQYTGHAVWNVHTKAGRERPVEEWVITERAHKAIIAEDEAKKIAEARRTLGSKKNSMPELPGVVPRATS